MNSAVVVIVDDGEEAVEEDKVLPKTKVTLK
jgi:hypothetical protein